MRRSKITRRQFVSKMAAGAVTAGFSLSAFSAANHTGPTPKSLDYRKLGRTGLRVSAVSFGAMTTSDPVVIRRAIDLGINYIDTARIYLRGENEKIVAAAIKDIPRDKVFLATKIPSSTRRRPLRPLPKEDMITLAEESLAALKTDYVDVLLIHSLADRDQVFNEYAMDVLAKLKKDGKVRFSGLSTHTNIPEVVDAAIESGFYDVILAKLNFKSDQADIEALERAAKAGIGIVAMKTQAGGYKTEEMGGFTPHQAALKWVLQHKFVANAIVGMTTTQQVEENFPVMKKPELAMREKVALKAYGDSIDGLYCRMCGKCEQDCPYGAPVAEINRCVMYAEGYRDEALARAELASLGRLPCIDCSACTVACRNHINVQAKIGAALRLLS